MSEKIYGIDMGTNSIKIYQKAAGVILHQKNMIAIVKKKEPTSKKYPRKAGLPSKEPLQ